MILLLLAGSYYLFPITTSILVPAMLLLIIAWLLYNKFYNKRQSLHISIGRKPEDYNKKMQEKFVEKWSKIRLKGKKHFVFVTAFENGITIALFVYFMLIISSHKLTWSYFISKTFWEGLIIDLALSPLFFAFSSTILWNSSEKKYKSLSDDSN